MKKDAIPTPESDAKSKSAAARAKRGYAYLRTDRFISEAKKAGKAGAQRSMDALGYVVISLDGWVVKKYKDGTIEKLEKI